MLVVPPVRDDTRRDRPICLEYQAVVRQVAAELSAPMVDGPALSDLQKMSADLGLSDHVTFTGRAPDEELFSVLSSADVCVNPDRVNPMNDQSTMNKILEYMAFSKPIVQFEVREGRYSAQEASLYAAPNDTDDLADKILTLLDDPAKCAEMGAYGRARVETELSWDHQVDTLVAAYTRVAEKK